MSDWSLELVAAMQQQDVPIGAGTDTPIAQAIPGYSLHTELERLVDAGLTTQQALFAATIRPAEFFKLSGSMGQIRAGMEADLVLLPLNRGRDFKWHTRQVNCLPDISPTCQGSGQHQTVPDRQCGAVHGFMTAGKPKSRFNVFRDHNG